MTAYEKLQLDVVKGFRQKRGKAGVYIYKPISPYNIIIKIVELFNKAHTNSKICIICRESYEAKELREYFNRLNVTSIIDVLSVGYVRSNFNYQYDLIITVKVEEFSKLKVISENTKFYLFIFDKRVINSPITKRIENNFNIINTTISVDKIINESIYSPVKETLIGVDLIDKLQTKYNEYSEFILQSMKIYGNFETLDKCRNGNKVMNLSNIQVCNAVATNNGWNEDLDTKEEFNRRVDEIYNPNALLERAQVSYNIMRQRRDLVTDYTGKYEEVLRICKENINKKILIISSRGSYAYELSVYLNTNGIPCGNYHDSIPDTYLCDTNGNRITYKTGVKQGEPKIFGTIYLSNEDLKRYNSNEINVLSIKNASDVKLSCDCDIVIITSPLCSEIFEIKRRYKNVLFRTNPLIVYTIYCNNTIEHTKLDKLENTPIHEIIRDEEINFMIE